MPDGCHLGREPGPQPWPGQRGGHTLDPAHANSDVLVSGVLLAWHVFPATDTLQFRERAVRVMSLWKWSFGLKAAETLFSGDALLSAWLLLASPGAAPTPLAPSNPCSAHCSPSGSPETMMLCPLTHRLHPGPTSARVFGPGLQLQQEGFWLDPRKHL